MKVYLKYAMKVYLTQAQGRSIQYSVFCKLLLFKSGGEAKFKLLFSEVFIYICRYIIGW